MLPLKVHLPTSSATEREYSRAADQDFASAQTSIGNCLIQEGKGFTSCENQVLYWFNLAAGQGFKFLHDILSNNLRQFNRIVMMKQ